MTVCKSSPDIFWWKTAVICLVVVSGDISFGAFSLIGPDGISPLFIKEEIIGGGVLSTVIVGRTLVWVAKYPTVKDPDKARLQQIHRSRMVILGEMSSGIIHEINQPLSIICMAADFALISMEEGEPDEKLIEKKLKSITSQCDRILSIISHMRAFSRNEPPSVAPFIIDDAMSSAIEMIEPQLRSDGIEINISLGDAADCKIMGCPVQLEQVLLNILANAHDTVRSRIQAKSKKEVFIPAIDIAMNYLNADSSVIISISNNGGNIPEGIINNIFDPFFTTRGKSQGTGLGLSISDSIIVGMGGHIGVENIADGVRFDIAIPTIRAYQD